MDKLSESLTETVESATLRDVNQNLVDILLETTENSMDDITDGFLKDIPILKTLVSLPKTFKGISDYFLLKKIVRFLIQLSSIPIEERNKFIKEMEGSKKNEIFENLILVLEKHENYLRSEIQGKIFKALVKGLIIGEEYDSMTYATSMINIQKIERLTNFYLHVVEGTSPEMSAELLYHFSSLELIHVDNSKIGTWGGGMPEFKKNSLGAKYVEIITT